MSTPTTRRTGRQDAQNQQKRGRGRPSSADGRISKAFRFTQQTINSTKEISLKWGWTGTMAIESAIEFARNSKEFMARPHVPTFFGK